MRTGPRSVLPFDRAPAVPGSSGYATANYAVLQGKGSARLITPDRPLDDAIEAPHHIHFETCPQQVTAEQLATMTQRRRNKR
ncbi:hypothetical protein [Actinotalea sp. JY-7876]|uniref:hypothetical protein n=1 Tax=Actinotalea sp. JY-7876 TaxID=2758442 RepID=UPI0015F5C465|nr:hypothetical protein [Actinotalea sp. JY-7876]